MQFQVEPHARFQRRGANILSKLRLKLSEALLGCKMPVDTAWGKRNVTIPPGTHGGTSVLLREEGAPRVDGGGRGDHILEVEVATPKTLSDDQRALVERLRDTGM